VRTICVAADSLQGETMNRSNKTRTEANEREREIRGGRRTYSSEIWRCWKSCHDRVASGFFDKFLRGRKQSKG